MRRRAFDADLDEYRFEFLPDYRATAGAYSKREVTYTAAGKSLTHF